MRMPPTLPRLDENGDEQVARLNRSLYGLKQAARQWSKMLTSFLVEWGFVQSSIDTCLFLYNGTADSGPDREGLMRLAVWVDDLVISASAARLRARFVRDLGSRFSLEDNGDLYWVLGVRVGRDRRRRVLTLSQSLYIGDLLGRHASHVTMSRRFDTPLSTGDALTHEQCPPDGSPEKAAMRDKHTTYMSVIGALLWLASFTRPDLAHAASVLARFVSNPARAHFAAMQRVLSYLHETRDMGLVFRPDAARPLEVYSDADWATRYSTSGCLILLFGCPMHWHSRLQRSVSHSTAEAEYIAASAAAREAVFFRELLHDTDRLAPGPTRLLMDSKSAIDMAFDPVAFKKTKHVLRDAEYLRDLVAREVLSPFHVETKRMIADIMTKAIERILFVALRASLVSAIDA
jgi:hypothetical protein